MNKVFRTIPIILILILALALNSCNSSKKSKIPEKSEIIYPSDVIPFMDKFKILLGDGTNEKNLIDYEAKDFFFTEEDKNDINWVVYKTPNSGVTSRTSSNTRTELQEKRGVGTSNWWKFNRHLKSHACEHFR